MVQPVERAGDDATVKERTRKEIMEEATQSVMSLLHCPKLLCCCCDSDSLFAIAGDCQEQEVQSGAPQGCLSD